MFKDTDKQKLKVACDFHNERSRENALSTLLGISTKAITINSYLSKRSAKTKLALSHYAATAKNSSRLDFSYFSPRISSRKARSFLPNDYKSRTVAKTSSVVASRRKIRVVKKNNQNLNSFLMIAPKLLVSQGASPKTGKNQSQQLFDFEEFGKSRHSSAINSRSAFRESGNAKEQVLVPKIKNCEGEVPTEIAAWGIQYTIE